jgi:hypothetical protein
MNAMQKYPLVSTDVDKQEGIFAKDQSKSSQMSKKQGGMESMTICAVRKSQDSLRNARIFQVVDLTRAWEKYVFNVR